MSPPSEKSISVIIPAYNEEERLPEVLKVVTSIPIWEKIIVTDDGSTDNTFQAAKKFKVDVIRNQQNTGKGAALQLGLNQIDSSIVVFLDADLINLTIDHIHDLINPVVKNQVDMTIGRFTGGRFSTNFSQNATPILNGQRALSRELLDALPDLSNLSFGVEVFLSKFAQKKGFRTVDVPLKNLSQVLKEEKNGIWSGLFSRLKMYKDIFKVLIFLRRQ